MAKATSTIPQPLWMIYGAPTFEQIEDKDSPFYVRPEYRDGYVQAAQDGDGYARLLARSIDPANEQSTIIAFARSVGIDVPKMDGTADWKGRTAAHLVKKFAPVTAQGVTAHVAGLDAGRIIAEGRASAARQEADEQVRTRCDICGQSDGTTRSRRGNPYNSPTGADPSAALLVAVKACDPCVALASVVIAERTGRRAAVEAWVTAQ
jgi:hypothetical protein